MDTMTNTSSAEGISLHHISVSDLDNNCYLLTTESDEGTQGLLIDAADNAPAILDLAESAGARITAVVTTHRHFDHVRALEDVLDATKAIHYASSGDSPRLPRSADTTLGEGDALHWAGHILRAHILRGHTQEGLALSIKIDGIYHLFVGDSLFPGGVGKTSTPADFNQLLTDVKTRLFDVYPDTAVVHPGHGKPTTLGTERPHLEQWHQRGW
ncbi:MBL fold metallo-hydrolase [Corynebacterium rouxii]|uniref:MBL fold metallo-hydrolase n=1 Tax=Corynebacterium rouxii TaxID=2719119 RepID=A0A6I8MEJ8_9CORY|nr:MBL fold metallo-hydrolase [Corynebacterium rouxii]MDT9408768.1 MBL fold metallo-hydrolase [Corynebacterium rouxii]MDT9410948.1 MBL fold metallo-hydrolase [Corynebacterium rouxii]VZH85148.1 MBL fold metallo-hydrolase [Corynebacterium rouxii]